MAVLGLDRLVAPRVEQHPEQFHVQRMILDDQHAFGEVRRLSNGLSDHSLTPRSAGGVFGRRGAPAHCRVAMIRTPNGPQESHGDKLFRTRVGSPNSWLMRVLAQYWAVLSPEHALAIGESKAWNSKPDR